jgi:hypothetical protein
MAQLAPISVQPPVCFQAAWPAPLDPAQISLCYKIAAFVWDLISIILFPIGLYRLQYAEIQQMIFQVALPGELNPPALLQILREELIQQLGAERITLETPDQVQLDGIFCPGLLSTKTILFAPGNAMQYETSGPFIDFLKHTGANVMMVNPRGVGESHGSPTPEGLALDIYTAYEYLINEKGLDPDDILLYGYSMGGCYGNRGAALVQEKYPDKALPSLIDRSFSNLAIEVYFTALNYVPPILAAIAYWAIIFFSCQMDSKAASDRLRGNRVIIYHPLDQVIPFEASFYQAVCCTSPTSNVHICELISTEEEQRAGRDAIHHSRRFCEEERLIILRNLHRLLCIPFPEDLEKECQIHFKTTFIEQPRIQV